MNHEAKQRRKEKIASICKNKRDRFKNKQENCEESMEDRKVFCKKWMKIQEKDDERNRN